MPCMWINLILFTIYAFNGKTKNPTNFAVGGTHSSIYEAIEKRLAFVIFHAGHSLLQRYSLHSRSS